MSRTTAKLYAHAIYNNKFDFDENKGLVLCQLDKFPKRTVKQLIKKYRIPQNILESYCDSLFSEYSSFVIIGCPESTDIDVVCIVDELNNFNGKTNPLSVSEFTRLKSEIYDELEYDRSKQLDINLITVKNKNVTSLLKGGKETQNMILATYTLHKQKYDCPELDFVHVDILEKCRAIAKFYIDHLENISLNYESIRDRKKESYSSTFEMLEFSKEIVKYIDFDNLGNSALWFDDMKSLTVKLVQIILLKNRIYEYTKSEMANKISKFGFEKEEVLWYLFRGKKGSRSRDCFENFHKSYVKILEDYFANISQYNFKICLKDITTYSNHSKYNLFFDSPNCASDEFEDQWNENFGDSSVNSVFVLNSTKLENRNNILKFFDNEFHENFIWINQRNEEWLSLLKFYVCGNNSKEIPCGFEGKFNLIRGTIAEILVSDHFSFEDFEKISLGLLVESTKKGSKGCAPDMILVNGTEIIPVEIKCLRSGTKNSDYYDSLDLAQKQCNGIKNIIDGFHSGLVRRKIVIISYFENCFFNYETNVINY